MRKLIYVLFILSAVSFSETTGQADWSGGDGVSGPVPDWGISYDNSSQIDSTNGTLQLNTVILANPVEHTVDGTYDSAFSVYAADVDGDGDTDVLGAAFLANDITWWENADGSGTVWIEHTVDGNFGGARSVYAADVDGDGGMDVLGAAYFADDITWWENTDGSGTVWVEHTVDGTFDAANSVYAADIDDDGDTDVLGAAYFADDITWWENADGAGTVWVEHTVDGTFDAASSVYAADVDGDGNTDVLGAANNADDITWWENTDGSGTVWVEHTVDGTFGGASSVFAADVDGDGDTDVLGAANNANDITWWENTDGSGTVWVEHTVDGTFGAAVSVYAADVDGDGNTDVLGAAYSADDITWWENTDGSGTVWVEHTVDGTFDGARSVYAADVDGDGNTDVLGVAYNANGITWWNLLGYDEGILESSILDAGFVDTWDIFYSNLQEPTGTSVAFQFRSSSDEADMGPWSDTLFSNATPLSGILADSMQYLQYRVILDTSDPYNTPVLEDVLFSYTSYVSIEENSSGDISSWALLPHENPSYGHFSAMIAVPEPGIVELALYDVTGRIIAGSSQEFPIGTHSVIFEGLAEGVYFCAMRAGEYTATEKVVVLE